ncbi:response regulator transcription factor [Promineifilum sp.]|uniref:response regulator n=1 Tax=Promineifilum sp. TaxID=2664178 RepID=UPI0035B1B92F
MISVLLVEDHAYVADAIGGLLETFGDISLSASAQTAEQALEQLPNLKVDLMLVDLALPGMNGIDLIARVREMYPELPCVVLSAHRELSYVRRAFEVGARGFITKEDPLAVSEGIHRVMEGEVYLSADLRE